MRTTVILLLLVAAKVRACGEGGGGAEQLMLDDKIVGGREAEEGEFPWQASLQLHTSQGFYHLCGASLVESDWLVTAAHCIQLDTVSSYRIMIGSISLEAITTDQIYKIKMIVIKKGFNKAFHNDIALLQLARHVHPTISAICLTDRALEANTTGVVTGWGATEDRGKASPHLQAAEVAIITKDECSEYYVDELTDSMTCAGYEEGGIDACQGDSGGPLLQWRDGRAQLVGIVSWGVGCAEPQSPGVYTDVFHFIPWIKHYVYGE